MTKEYITSEEHLPDDLGSEVTFQITDRATKEIFTTRARVSADPTHLDEPDRLTVVRGPHENIEEEWFIEILEAEEAEGIDRDVLRERVRRAREESNIVNTRADDVMAMLEYLVDRGRYESVSDAARHMLREHLRETHPDLVEAYIEARTAVERDDLASELGGEEG
jgi:hypothetical protein